MSPIFLRIILLTLLFGVPAMCSAALCDPTLDSEIALYNRSLDLQDNATFVPYDSAEKISFQVAGPEGGVFSSMTVEMRELGGIKKEIEERLLIGSSRVREAARDKARESPGELNIGQICAIYDYLKGNWSYISDVHGRDYFQSAEESLSSGPSGDCDDFAILISSMIESIGGSTRIILSTDANNMNGHAYAEVYLGTLSKDASIINKVMTQLRSRYDGTQISNPRPNPGDEVWLNLDMNTGFPGGKTTGAQKRVLALRENVSKGAVLPANEPPIPKILFEPMIPDVNETVRFDGGSQSIDDGGIRDYIWTFGDQKPNKKGPKVDHEYAKAEVYRVTLKVVDYLGLSNSTYIDLRVNSPPIADFEYKQSGESELQFVSNSTDADGRIVEYNWDFGDGDSSKKPSPKHPYEGKGPFEVSLSVKDDAGSVAVITRTVKINQPPVVAIDYSPKMPGVGTKIKFTGIADDPDGSVKSVFFDFGDGETSDIRTPIHQFKSGGAKTITFSAKDDNDAVNSTSIDIYVNIPPQASFTFSPDNPNVGDFVTFDAGSSYDTEPGNLRYTWDFGDDTPPLTKNTTTARHKFEEANIFTVSLKVTDEWGDESEAAKKVTVGTKPTGATPAEMPSVGYATAPSPNETVPAVAAESAWAMPKPLNRPPSIDTMRHDPEYPYVANIVTFTASYSDPDGQVVRLLWDFGDGSFDIITPAINTGGTRIEHTYGGVGNYVVNLTATDNNGASDFRSELITIIPTPSGYNSTSMQPSTTIASPAEVTIQEYPPMRPVPAEACENCTSASS